MSARMRAAKAAGRGLRGGACTALNYAYKVEDKIGEALRMS